MRQYSLLPVRRSLRPMHDNNTNDRVISSSRPGTAVVQSGGYAVEQRKRKRLSIRAVVYNLCNLGVPKCKPSFRTFPPLFIFVLVVGFNLCSCCSFLAHPRPLPSSFSSHLYTYFSYQEPFLNLPFFIRIHHLSKRRNHAIPPQHSSLSPSLSPSPSHPFPRVLERIHNLRLRAPFHRVMVIFPPGRLRQGHEDALNPSPRFQPKYCSSVIY